MSNGFQVIIGLSQWHTFVPFLFVIGMELSRTIKTKDIMGKVIYAVVGRSLSADGGGTTTKQSRGGERARPLGFGKSEEDVKWRDQINRAGKG